MMSISTHFYPGTHLLTDDQFESLNPAPVQLPSSAKCSLHDTAVLHFGAGNSAERGTGFHTHLLNISFCSADCYETPALLEVIRQSYVPQTDFTVYSFAELRA